MMPIFRILLACLAWLFSLPVSSASYDTATGILDLPQVSLSASQQNYPTYAVSLALAADPEALRFHLQSAVPHQPPPHEVYASQGNLYEQHVLAGEWVLLKKPQSPVLDMFNLRTHEWQQTPPMPVDRRSAGYAALAGKIYVFGGGDGEFDIFAPQTYSAEVLIYDLATRHWSRAAAPMPAPLLSPQARSWGGKLYVIGGHVPSVRVGASYSNQIRVYDPLADSWQVLDTVVPYVQLFLAYPAVHVLGDKLLVMGHEGIENDSLARSYDPVSNTWQEETGKPDRWVYRDSVEVDGAVYFIGAHNSYQTASNPSMLRYDLATQTWQQIPPPAPELGPQVKITALDGALYLFDMTPALLLLQRYEPATQHWTTVLEQTVTPPRAVDGVFTVENAQLYLPVVEVDSWRFAVTLQLIDTPAGPRFELIQATLLDAYQPPRLSNDTALATVGTALYLLGGSTTGRSMRGIQRFLPAQQRWEYVAALPVARRGGQAVAVGEDIYLTGGWNSSYRGLGRVDVLATRDHSLRSVAPLPIPRSRHAAVNWDEMIYVIGGIDAQDQTLTDVQRYSPTDQIWQSAESLPAPRHSGTAAVANRRIYYLGGQDAAGTAQDTVWMYEPSRAWLPRAPMPIPSYGHSSTTWQGEIVVWNNFNGADLMYNDTLQVYTPTTNTWRSVKTSGELFSSVNLFTLNDNLYGMGWFDIYVPETIPAIYQYLTNAWQPVQPKPLSRRGSAAVHYQAHVEHLGWSDWRQNGATAGTNGFNLRLEAMRLSVSDLPQCGLRYRSYVNGQGWTPWAYNGAVSGSSGQAQAIAALQIELIESYCEGYLLEYRVYQHDQGWLGPFYDGDIAGTPGNMLEALEVLLWQPCGGGVCAKQ